MLISTWPSLRNRHDNKHNAGIKFFVKFYTVHKINNIVYKWMSWNFCTQFKFIITYSVYE